jgi:arginase
MNEGGDRPLFAKRSSRYGGFGEMRTLGLVGVPSSMGAFAPGQEKAPRALRDAGLLPGLGRVGVAVVDHGDLPLRRWYPDPAHRTAQHATLVAEVAQETAKLVEQIIAEDHIPLVLGGDCTIELGTVAGFLIAGRGVGLIYLDLHPDLNVPDVVPDGALDWMGMAHLLGVEGAVEGLVRVGPTAPMLDAERVVFLGYGPTEATAFEREVIARRGIAAIPIEEVAARPEEAVSAALASLPDIVDNVLVHFDVDIVDFTDLPLSEERIRNRGLTFSQATRALGALLADERFAALTITELNPDHGAEDGSTLVTFVEGLVEALVPR